MNTILILTAKSRAAEVMRDKRVLKRATALNAGSSPSKRFENAGETAARLVDEATTRVKRRRRTGYWACNRCGFRGDSRRGHVGCKISAVFIPPDLIVGSPPVASEWKRFEKWPGEGSEWKVKPMTPTQLDREMEAARRGALV